MNTITRPDEATETLTARVTVGDANEPVATVTLARGNAPALTVTVYRALVEESAGCMQPTGRIVIDVDTEPGLAAADVTDLAIYVNDGRVAHLAAADIDG